MSVMPTVPEGHGLFGQPPGGDELLPATHHWRWRKTGCETQSSRGPPQRSALEISRSGHLSVRSVLAGQKKAVFRPRLPAAVLGQSNYQESFRLGGCSGQADPQQSDGEDDQQLVRSNAPITQYPAPEDGSSCQGQVQRADPPHTQTGPVLFTWIFLCFVILITNKQQ